MPIEVTLVIGLAPVSGFRDDHRIPAPGQGFRIGVQSGTVNYRFRSNTLRRRLRALLARQHKVAYLMTVRRCYVLASFFLSFLATEAAAAH